MTKVTDFNPNGLPLPLGGWSTGYSSIGSNTDSNPPLSALNFVQRITANTSNTLLNPIVNFASGSNILLTLDAGPANSIPSNTIRIHSTGGGGSATISAGSNSTWVQEISTAGASSTLWSPFDHAHAGVQAITSSSSNTLQKGVVNIRAGSGIAIGLTDTDGDGEFDTATLSTTSQPSGGSSSFENWNIELNMVAGDASGNTNWTTHTQDSTWFTNTDFESSGAQNDEVYWDLGMSGGTWDFILLHSLGPNRGIYTVSIDGSSIGTIDGYNVSGLGASKNNYTTITGFTVTSGKRRLKLKMATKNASSSAYFGTIHHIALRRTA